MIEQLQDLANRMAAGVAPDAVAELRAIAAGQAPVVVPADDETSALRAEVARLQAALDAALSA